MARIRPPGTGAAYAVATPRFGDPAPGYLMPRVEREMNWRWDVPTWVWILLIVLLVLALTGGVGVYRR